MSVKCLRLPDALARDVQGHMKKRFRQCFFESSVMDVTRLQNEHFIL